MKQIVIIDLDIGNSAAVKNMLSHLGYAAEILTEPNTNGTVDADCLILPGVGNFKSIISALERRNWLNCLKNIHASQNFLGICVGYQILYAASSEATGTKGLNLIECCLSNLNDINGYIGRVPNVGWHTEVISKREYYFTHSYGIEAKILAERDVEFDYIMIDETKIVSRVRKDNYQGVQFHPEKSGISGFEFFEEYLSEI